MPNSPKTLAERLSQARKAMGLGQAEVAKHVGISQPSYSELERGISKSTTRIATLAHVLKVNPYWLETGEGESGIDSVHQVSDFYATHVREQRAHYGDPEEQTLLDLFRRLPARKKRAILDLMNSESPAAEE